MYIDIYEDAMLKTDPAIRALVYGFVNMQFACGVC